MLLERDDRASRQAGKGKSTRRSVLESPASEESIRKILAAAPDWPWIAVAANGWEISFILLPPAACMVFMALQLVVGEPDFLYCAAWLARETVCMFGDVVALCRAEEWFDWTPGFSLLALVNVAALLSTVVLLAVIIMRRWYNLIIFRRPRRFQFVGLLVLISVLMFFWGIHFYIEVSLLGAVVMSGISVVALNELRFAAACMLTPAPSPPPRQKIRNGWFGPPIRQARFAPGVETGESGKKEDNPS